MEPADAVTMLADYLRDTGYSQPEDAAQQLQIAMLREWVAHLCAVLNKETTLTRAEKLLVIRAMIYGAAPREAELQLRQNMAQHYSSLISRNGWPKIHVPGIPD